MNRVILMGRLTRDPEIRYSQNSNDQLAIARFTLAVDRRFKRDGENSADFISCKAFGKTAEFMRNYTRQGTKLCVEGRIETGSYVRQDGTKVYTTEVVLDNVEFAESKAAEAGRQPGMAQSQGQWQNQGQNQWQSQRNQQPPQSPNSQSYGQSYASQGYSQPAQSDQGFGSYGAPAGDPQSFMAPPVSEPQQSEAQGEGFMSIPDAVDDEGLPFS